MHVQKFISFLKFRLTLHGYQRPIFNSHQY
ncbi:hypothetical protein NC652_003694 [Populus alba x Populus x berolinensis]|uniref:Uncharacterized protein n=1 Tax=Populus alba x Populus x berolinensis TaxID=444605 RepID=A0AAD6M6S4_9ROSI|nr:hypothetical protein NC652_027871 [Populus alba x Populus x berolinensis]KAJ6965896.1 hypothetical protein NC652_003694 [Populus alba x Populus x berolinensis]KAJ6979495.1 hypothetical protein NC653_027599 [Populus alba x Populus x berolinensis]KAJ6979499.1 hypothetical protein NC653_027602 [Populus alba x Populus x berolinensis]